uniref:Uncharacterized protein n=1 Tax=Chromera velia CCMP2878 TaxID=1169474 RepID=A0A0G4HYQ7_9ALVE|eukprot:Cvel_9533.t1-p1 / transcript=Cvel_9533.t1 / gene=Cvel_9533 / organism=Chromera_velia_CCMP2878 / gene_product=hypothetical protein / transcript_product=hypothetical protein / location=Cvel_scaffold552:34622-35407(-) / protein_length=262 / sequence_SO=supercontig / SO=protein_coding / is_pseudo=false
MGSDAALNIRMHGAVGDPVDEDQGGQLPLTTGKGVKEGNELVLYPPCAEISFVPHLGPHRDNLFLQQETGNYSTGRLYRLNVLLNVGGVRYGQGEERVEVCEHPLVFGLPRQLQDKVLAVVNIIRLGRREIRDEIVELRVFLQTLAECCCTDVRQRTGRLQFAVVFKRFDNRDSTPVRILAGELALPWGEFPRVSGGGRSRRRDKSRLRKKYLRQFGDIGGKNIQVRGARALIRRVFRDETTVSPTRLVSVRSWHQRGKDTL